MNFQIVVKILMLIPVLSIAQESDHYLTLMSNFKISDSTQTETYFKNRQQNYVGTETLYEYKDYIYSFPTGKHIRHYKNGARTETIYNSWGVQLENKYFDKIGNLISHSRTKTIDTSAKDIEEYHNSRMHMTFVIVSKEYKFSSKYDKWFLSVESEYTNGKKSGDWKYYYPNGDLKKLVQK